MSNPFLANVWAPFAAGEQLAGVPSASGALPPPMVPSVAPSPFLNQVASGMAPAGTPPPPPIEPPPGPTPPVAPPSQSMAGPPPPDPMAPPMPGNEFHLQSAGGGGVIAAHEADRRGPSLKAAQVQRNDVADQTIAQVGDRNAGAADNEQAMALEQERQARGREAAQQQSIAERDEEMAQKQNDFDGSVKQLGKAGAIDPDRFWSSRSTSQKIAGFIELAISGFRGAPSMLMKRIDDDVKAQEFAYHAARDVTNAKQTAFSQAMQKYQNADAARAAARAAAIDVTQAQFAQVGAKWKGTETANRADMAHASLQDEKMMQIANGIQFIPSQMAGRRYTDPRTGLVYSEAEAKAIMGKVDERDFENRKQVAAVGGQMAVEGVKAETDLQKAAIAQGGKADEGARHIAGQLQTAGVPQARAAAERALAAMNKSEGGRGELAARAMLPNGVAKAVLSDDSNSREQAYSEFMNAAMKATFGNVTASEEVRAANVYGNTGDPRARKQSINAVLQTLEEIEKNAKAGETPTAQARFDAGREAAKGDKPAAPASASKGWK